MYVSAQGVICFVVYNLISRFFFIGIQKCTEDNADKTANEDCCKGDFREGEGDCDKDSDCADGFTCGSNNCAWSTWVLTWSDLDDCCTANARV